MLRRLPQLSSGTAVGTSTPPLPHQYTMELLRRAASDPPPAAAAPLAAGAEPKPTPATLAAASRLSDLLDALADQARSPPVIARSVSDPRDPHWPVEPSSWSPGQAMLPGRGSKAPRLVFPPWTPPKPLPTHSGGHIKKLLKHYSVSCSIREDSALKTALAGGAPYIAPPSLTAAQAEELVGDELAMARLPPLFGWCLHTFSAEAPSSAAEQAARHSTEGDAACAASGTDSASAVGHFPSPRDFVRHGSNLHRLQSRLLQEGRGGGGAGSILLDDNAGGASENSESLSAELLGTCYDTVMCRSETSVPYMDAHSSIVDYVARWSGVWLGHQLQHRVGVSVTRAMKFVRDRPDPHAFTDADAVHLLSKKLSGLRNASHSVSMHYTWSRRVLHIWADTATVAAKLKRTLQRSVLWGIATGRLTQESIGRIVEQEDPMSMFCLYSAQADGSSSSSAGSTPSLNWLDVPQNAAKSSTGAASQHPVEVYQQRPYREQVRSDIVPPELLVDAFVMVTVCEPRSLMYGIIFENKQQWVPVRVPESQSAAAAQEAARRSNKAARDSDRRRARGRSRGRGRGRSRKPSSSEEQTTPSTNKYHVVVPNEA